MQLFEFNIEIIIENVQDLKKIQTNLNDDLKRYSDVLILTNMVLADSYLYEFELWSKYLTN